MKTIKQYLLLNAGLACCALGTLLTACSQDDNSTAAQGEATLQVETATVGTRVAAFNNQFANSDVISLSLYDEKTGEQYLSGSNYYTFTYSSGKWTPATQVKLNKEWATVYAVYPAQYVDLKSGGVKVDITGTSFWQEYLYAEARVTSEQPRAYLKFQHALAAVTLNVKLATDSTLREGYQYRLQTIGLTRIAATGIMHMPSGDITCDSRSWGRSVSTKSYTADSATLLALPDTMPNSQVEVKVNDKYIYANLPENTVWEKGTHYTYDVTVHVTLDDIYLTLSNPKILPRTEDVYPSAIEADVVVETTDNQ